MTVIIEKFLPSLSDVWLIPENTPDHTQILPDGSIVQ